jgi:hypothetical protein
VPEGPSTTTLPPQEARTRRKKGRRLTRPSYAYGHETGQEAALQAWSCA